jgi:type I restriction enzyme S subunit
MVSTMTNVEAMKIPEGYKQTEVGVIPEDWLVEPLENFTSFISYGFTNPMPTSISGPSMVTARDINSGRILYESARKTTEEAYKNLLSPKSKPKINDVLLTKDGTLGRLALVDKENICINQSVALLRPNDRISPIYFKKLLESSYYQKQMIENAGGSTIKHIYITIVNRMLINVPPLNKEQTAIANALSDVDKLIAALETLIAKKSAIKTAAMQQLLTGKKRLPAFAGEREGQHLKANEQCNAKPNEKHRTQPNSASDTPAQHHSDAENNHHQHTPRPGYKHTELGEIPEDWEVKSVANIASNIIDYRGVTPRKLGMEWGGGDIVALSAGNVKKGCIDLESECYLGSEQLYKRWMRNGDVCKGDIVFTMEAPLGNVAIIPDDRKYILSQRTIALQVDKVLACSSFIYQYFVSNEFQTALSDRATGSTAQGIKRTVFELLRLPLPSVKEQTAIANVLSDMDTELDALQQRLAKTQAIKQGMMQELLTGKTRLV